VRMNLRLPASASQWGATTVYLLLLTLTAGCSGTSKSDDLVAEATSVADNSTDQTTDPISDPDSPLPTLAFNTSVTTIAEGGVATLTWSTSESDSCVASGAWSGSRGSSGSEVVGPLTAGATFSLTCSGAGGSAIQMLSVGVIGPVDLRWVAPTENVDGSPLTDLDGYRIYYGQFSRDYSGMVDVDDSGVTAHSLDLASGDYFLAMTAVDGEGNESAYSNEVLKIRP
jgi:hypothetical protein